MQLQLFLVSVLLVMSVGLTTHHQSQADPKDPLTYGMVFFVAKNPSL
jgi:hypothetical protein